MAKDKHELESMNKDELVSYADDMDIEVQHSWLKEDIVSAILKGQRAAARQGAGKPLASKEAKMDEEAEVKPVKVTGPINIKGMHYEAGDVVFLTEEEAAHLTELKAPIEGVEAATEEEVQAAHEAGVEAQNAEVEVRAKEEAEKEARDEAYESGEEFDEAKFSEGTIDKEGVES